MHLRKSKKRQHGKTYEYNQLVHSYRRPDGVPSHRVIANLGKLSDLEVENLRHALKASREDRSLVVQAGTSIEGWQTRVEANFRYLDVAVALEAWNRWKLPELLNRLLPLGMEAVHASKVIAALVIQRCTDPGSKLHAVRWFPRTSLPELLDLGVDPFNNTRVHRVLEQLDGIDDDLQRSLPSRYQSKGGAFSAMFMDVTDAWFEGRGPAMAERNRTKEGFKNRRKIGLTLVCNEHGYPIRWKTAPGKRRDAECMEDLLSLIQEEPWVRDTPIILDRAMGNGKSIAKLMESGMKFLTATTRKEIESFTPSVPSEHFLDLAPVDASSTREAEMRTAGERALDSGMQRIDDYLYYQDFGVVERQLVFGTPKHEYSGVRWDPNELEGGASFIALARIFEDRLDKKVYLTRSDLAAKQGLTRARVTQIMNTLRLDVDLQERIMAGEFGYVSERYLRECAKIEGSKEQREFIEQCTQTVRPARHAGASVQPPQRVGRKNVGLRLVAYFNPQMFVEQRARFCRRRQRVEQFIEKLNQELASSDTTRDKDLIMIQVRNELARWKLLSVFEFKVKKSVAGGHPHWKIAWEINEAAWSRRARYAGFVLLVGHAELSHSGEELVRLYRQKDTIEKDFQTIKSTLKLRPFYHHTDPKVRAHVTICMLALLLERTIERNLKPSGLTEIRSGAACFEELRSCHLNLIHADPNFPATYVPTEATQEQLAILRSLRMKELAVPESIAESLNPRHNA